MDKITKKKLYESIMRSTSKVVKRKLNEMATRSNRNILMAIKQLIDDYAETYNVSSIEIKKALGTLSRKWVVNTTISNKNITMQDIQNLFYDIAKYRSYGNPIKTEDLMRIKKYVKNNLDFWEADDDSDSEADRVSNHNCDEIYDFLKEALSKVTSDIFSDNFNYGKYSENIVDSYNADGNTSLFTYLITGEENGDMLTAEDIFYNQFDV